MKIKKGTGVYGGIAIGRFHVLESKRYQFIKKKVEDPQAEYEKFKQAKEKAAKKLYELYQKALTTLGKEQASIFETHQMMLEDQDFNETIQNKIIMESIDAEYATYETGKEFQEIFSQMDDEYMKARAADIKDITERLLDNLQGYSDSEVNFQDSVIILADDLTPSQTVSLDKSKIVAFVTKEGSSNSHTAILARMMNIPSVVKADVKVSRKYQGVDAIVNGFTGDIYIEPDEETLTKFKKLQKEDLDRREKLKTLKGQENITKDGKKIKIFANIGGPKDVDSVIENDASGIGLFRSEFLYLGRTNYPTEEEQFEAYKSVLEAIKDKNVIIRTLDIGADKQIGYFNLPVEENPAMGYRAIRICLDRKEVFKTQLRALYRASVFGKLSIMYPMIISVQEVLSIKEICREIETELTSKGIAFSKDIEHGIMIETPSAAIISDKLAEVVDFFSIGTNDLTQYTLAIDRQNQNLESIYDPHHLSVLRLLKQITDNAHKAGIWVGICGELGADLELTEFFLRIGIDELSVSPPFVLELRDKIRNLDLTNSENEDPFDFV